MRVAEQAALIKNPIRFIVFCISNKVKVAHIQWYSANICYYKYTFIDGSAIECRVYYDTLIKKVIK